jgi:hypothetical protein
MLVHNATYIRASTVRPNTRYFISWVQRNKMEETAVTVCLRRRAQLQKHGLKGLVYCRSKKLCETLADALNCLHYHADVVDRAERLEAWEAEGGLIVATSALGTGVDYPGIVFVLHVGMPWSMIDFAQESGRGGRNGEVVDSVVLVEHGEVERMLAQKGADVDVQAVGAFVTSTGCRRWLMSAYMDRSGVSCGDLEESAGCDQCGDGTRQWLDEQVSYSGEWQQVEELFSELQAGCVVCCMVDKAGSEAWRQHRTMKCTVHRGVTGMEVDAFRRGIVDRGGTHSCLRCWVSQKYCATGKDVSNRCQWPNVVVPMARAAAQEETGVQIIRHQCGYSGGLGGDWSEYAAWLGKRHSERVWGEYFSNAMVVAIRVSLFMQQYTKDG